MADPVELARGLAFPEGPALAPDGTLWCTEARGGALVRVGPHGLERHDTGGLPCGMAFDGHGRAWFTDARANAIRWFDPVAGTWGTAATTLDGAPLDAPNDLAFDATGHLVFSCPGDSRFDATGSVCVLTATGEVRELFRGLLFPNGIAFSADNRTLYVAETYGRRVWRGTWDAERASWVNPAPWADLGGEPGPDGMALGADGLLYVAHLRGSRVAAVDDAGRVVREVAVPAPRPTNVCFAPGAMFVTEAEAGLLLRYDGEGPGVPPFRPVR